MMASEEGASEFVVRRSRRRFVIALIFGFLLLSFATVQIVWGPFDIFSRSLGVDVASYGIASLAVLLIVMTGKEVSRIDAYISANRDEIWCHAWPRIVPWKDVKAVEANWGLGEHHFIFVLGNNRAGEREQLTCSIPRPDCEFGTIVSALRSLAERNSVPLYSA
jgi:hypothetical protein